MSDDTSQDLIEALRFARVVSVALPVDDEADALAAQVPAANRHAPKAYRILSKRAAP